jgi:hypothetical protein
MHIDDQVERIQLENPAAFGKCFLDATGGNQQVRVPVMRMGVIGIQPERVGELLLGRDEIPVIMQIRVPETRVRFGIVFV